MIDTECVRFLQWALPRLHLRWSGFRKVRKQVCKRIGRRLAQLELPDTDSYGEYLARHKDEWQILDRLCRVVVTRFYRDKRVFEALIEKILPELASVALATDDKTLRCWSVGSASGEEPYTLAILWRHLLVAYFPELTLTLLATEVDPQLLVRSRRARYPNSSLTNLPAGLREAAFDQTNDHYCLRSEYKTMVKFRQQDVRTNMPDGIFHIILCRNLVFTYFDEALQEKILAKLLTKLIPGGWLVVGVRERLPATNGLISVNARLGLYQKAASTGNIF